jgi:predicted transcriptional regulator
VLQESKLPDDHANSSHVSLRVPDDVIQAFDKLAGLLDRPRSWVMLRALRHYLDEEGAELAADAASLAQLDRGESAPFDAAIGEVERIIRKRSPKAGRKR